MLREEKVVLGDWSELCHDSIQYLEHLFVPCGEGVLWICSFSVSDISIFYAVPSVLSQTLKHCLHRLLNY